MAVLGNDTTLFQQDTRQHECFTRDHLAIKQRIQFFLFNVYSTQCASAWLNIVMKLAAERIGALPFEAATGKAAAGRANNYVVRRNAVLKLPAVQDLAIGDPRRWSLAPRIQVARLKTGMMSGATISACPLLHSIARSASRNLHQARNCRQLNQYTTRETGSSHPPLSLSLRPARCLLPDQRACLYPWGGFLKRIKLQLQT